MGRQGSNNSGISIRICTHIIYLINITTSVDSKGSLDLNIRIEFVLGRTADSMLLLIFCTSMACKAALVLAVSCIMVTLTVVILITRTLSSTLVIIFRHSLPISSDTRTFMSINIRAHVYQDLYWNEYLVLLLIFELAQMFIATRMSVLAV